MGIAEYIFATLKIVARAKMGERSIYGVRRAPPGEKPVMLFKNNKGKFFHPIAI